VYQLLVDRSAVRKFLFDPTAVASLPARPHVGLRAGQPFVLDEYFQPVETLNTWLASLPTRGAHSPATWSGYADDLIAWARFLRLFDLELTDSPDALREALNKYRETRLHGAPGLDSGFGPLGVAAWNRAVSAMENFYEWAVETGRVSAKPFRYRAVKVYRGSAEHRGLTQANLARARRGAPHATLRSLAGDWATMFVSVGLGGQLPDGAPDPSFRGRTAVRNQALGAFVRSSGLRRAEFANLLVWEVPAVAGPAEDHVELPVPAAIAKGSKARSTWVSNRALDLVADYVGLERDLAVSGSPWQPQEPLLVEDPNEHSGRVNGQRVKWASLSIPERRRLVGPDGGSALLFVRSNGAPVDLDAWREVFDAASARCRAFESRFPRVTPHVLRHTFAVETLRVLTLNAMRRARRLADVSGADPLLMSVLRRNDPLLIVRDMLGHQSLKTTEMYLKLQGVAGVFTDAELEMLEEDDLIAERDGLEGAAS
jgi:site-specific recombinase XerD